LGPAGVSRGPSSLATPGTSPLRYTPQARLGGYRPPLPLSVRGRGGRFLGDYLDFRLPNSPSSGAGRGFYFDVQTHFLGVGLEADASSSTELRVVPFSHVWFFSSQVNTACCSRGPSTIRIANFLGAGCSAGLSVAGLVTGGSGSGVPRATSVSSGPSPGPAR